MLLGKNVMSFQCFLSNAVMSQGGPWEKWQVEPFAVSAKTGQLWDIRFLRVMGTGGGSPSEGKRQPFPPRPKWEHGVQGRKQRQWSSAFLRDLSGPGQGRGTQRRKHR